MQFTLELQDRIELAIDDINEVTSNLELRFFHFTDFGKNVPKKFKCSPDAFFQVVLQVKFCYKFLLNIGFIVSLHILIIFSGY